MRIANAPLNRIMSATRNETILVQERLHPAVFILPVFAALATGLPTLMVLLMIHVVMTVFTSLMIQFTNHQITLFNGYFYFLASLPTIFFTGTVFMVTLVAYLKSTRVEAPSEDQFENHDDSRKPNFV